MSLPLPLSCKNLATPLVVLVVSCLLWLYEPASSEWFAYHRNLISEGQWWRLVTGHFLHTNSNHLLLNLAGLALLWALHGFYFSYYTILTIVLLCLGTSLGIYFFSKELIWYVGLSGILHGLFIIGAYYDIEKKIVSGWIILLGVWVKIIYEQSSGPNLAVSSLIEANVAIDAHLYGTISGSLLIIVLVIKRLLSAKKV